MPETKQQLLDKAKTLGLKVDPTTKMADLRVMIADQSKTKTKVKSDEVKSEKMSTQPAKAGKRSSKSLRAAEEEDAKKTKLSETSSLKTAKSSQKPPRSKLERRAKGYRKVAEKLEANKSYSLSEAVELAKNTSTTKFDASVELHLNLNVDPRQADQNIRDSVILPAGSGKKLRVAVLSEEPKVATDAGADLAGDDDLIDKIGKGSLDFDILIATPSLMPKLGKHAKILGPKGLMPNPKSGTVTNDIKKAVTEAKAGRIEYRVDPSGIVHLNVGKVSFNEAGLKDNIVAVITSIRANKPSSVKSNYLKSAYLATTMGPSINVDVASLNDAVSSS